MYRGGFKHVEALWAGSLLEAPIHPHNFAIIYMHFYEWRCFPVFVLMISYFLFHIISFKKYFYVSLGNNFLLFFCGGPLAVEAPGQLPSLPPPLNPAVGM